MNNSYQTQNLSDAHIYRRFAGGLYRTTSRGKDGWMVDLISGVLHFFVSIGAFTVRVFLRREMGSRSFGILTIILGYLWVRLALIFGYINHLGCEAIYDLPNGEICTFSRSINLYFEAIFDLLKVSSSEPSMFFTIDLYSYLKPFNHPDDFGFWLDLLSIGIVFLGLVQLAAAFFKDIKKVKSHSFYRGISNALNWFKGKKLLGFIEINDHLIWAIFEPMLVFFISYVLEFFFNLDVLASTLRLGAICLSIQEIQIWNRNRDMIRNMIDQEIDSQILLEEREKYKEAPTVYRNEIFQETNGKAIVE